MRPLSFPRKSLIEGDSASMARRIYKVVYGHRSRCGSGGVLKIMWSAKARILSFNPALRREYLREQRNTWRPLPDVPKPTKATETAQQEPLLRHYHWAAPANFSGPARGGTTNKYSYMFSSSLNVANFGTLISALSPRHGLYWEIKTLLSFYQPR